MTGEGTCGPATFSFTVQKKTASSAPKGDLRYRHLAAGVDVRSLTITSLNIAGDTASFAGTCRNAGVACTFTVTIADNSEPGTGDEFQIKVVTGATEYIAGGVITSGNIQVHQT